MNDNLEKELNEIENVEKQNQEHLKNIDSKMDELNELVNSNIVNNSQLTNNVQTHSLDNNNENFKENDNYVDDDINYDEIEEYGLVNGKVQKLNNFSYDESLKIKKEIFEHRFLVRWTSFFSFFLGLVLILAICFWQINLNFGFFDSYFFNNNFLLNSMFLVLMGLCIFFTMFSFVFSWVLNIKLLIKLKTIRWLYLPIFIFSFVIPFLTWLYCVGLMTFAKHNNKKNYYEWLKQTKIEKYNNKIQYA